MRKMLSLLMVTALGAVVASAQTQPATATNPQYPATTDVARNTNTVPAERHDYNNWGLLGLVGLFGLTGLRRRDVGVRHVEQTRNERFGRNRDDIRRVG